MVGSDYPSQTFVGHLAALRVTLLSCLSVLVLGCVVTACLLPWGTQWLNYPLSKGIALSGLPEAALQGLVTTRPMGVFSVLIEVCLMGGIFLSLPLQLYIVGRFVAPALSAREKAFIGPFCLAAFFLFLMGAAIAYFILLPTSLAVAMKLNRFMGFELIWSASEYYSLVVWVTLSLGLAFEFPLLLLGITYCGIVPIGFFKRFRRVAFVVFLVLAALINPSGDPITMLLLGGLMHLLYEGALGLAQWLRHRNALLQEASLRPSA